MFKWKTIILGHGPVMLKDKEIKKKAQDIQDKNQTIES